MMMSEKELEQVTGGDMIFKKPSIESNFNQCAGFALLPGHTQAEVNPNAICTWCQHCQKVDASAECTNPQGILYKGFARKR